MSQQALSRQNGAKEMRAALDKERFGPWALVTGASSGIIDRNWELLCIVGDPEVNRRRPIRWTSKKSAREPVTIPTADAAPRPTNLCGNLVPAERSEASNRLRQSNMAL